MSSSPERPDPPVREPVLRDQRGAPVYDDVLWRYEQEGTWQRFKRKFKDYPFVYIGFAAGVGVLTYAIRSYKRRRLDPSLRVRGTDQYILQFRVIVQGTVVGCITMGAVWEMIKRNYLPSADGESTEREPGRVPTAAEARRAALTIDLMEPRDGPSTPSGPPDSHH